ncbi:hypothetical protein [Lacinutrix salivirga]
MTRFIKKIALFCLPLIILAGLGINLDLLKVFKSYDTLYDNNNIVTINRTLASTKILLKHRDVAHYNAFVFGSSRSQAFKAEHWEQYLPENASTFHYDGMSEGIYNIYKKLEFLDSQKFDINYALIIIDRSTLLGTEKQLSHLQINPIIFNDISKFNFYCTNLKASLNPKLIVAYLDYSVFKTHRNYMQSYIRRYKYPDTFTPIYNDSYYGNDKLIAEDSLGYYKKMYKKNFFRERPATNYKKLEVTNKELKLLKAIKTILNKHNTSYKIVISPIYDQIPMEKEQLTVLQSIFKTENVYDFSGINSFTTPISNYYEYSHFRPHVANKILDSIY